ncbi:response regulator transcription factor [Pelomonas puraquae]|uniref:OmpR/PhoB-type domain-containing protein n=1 Tax=Roseateles puraquae TaxID=431059 RepID=A0A254N9F8_9BURK|nr:response regulator transcription factor [Roseateles puraquae]OWR04625.1 hypothetical protein CDO81_08565 [Roseateles puraquae]
MVVLCPDGGSPIASLLRAGADLVLPAGAGAEEVQAAIEAVQRRVHPPGATKAPWTFAAGSSRLLTPEGYEIDLSEAEQQVIASFALASGEPVSREQLMQRVWGQSLSNQHPGAQRLGRSGAGRRPGTRLCRRGRRGAQPGSTQCAGSQGDQGTHRRQCDQGGRWLQPRQRRWLGHDDHCRRSQACR